MIDDIVTRLREHRDDEKQLGNDLLAEVLRDAADEIERLREQVAEYQNLYLLRSQLGDAIGGAW